MWRFVTVYSGRSTRTIIRFRADDAGVCLAVGVGSEDLCLPGIIERGLQVRQIQSFLGNL